MTNAAASSRWAVPGPPAKGRVRQGIQLPAHQLSCMTLSRGVLLWGMGTHQGAGRRSSMVQIRNETSRSRAKEVPIPDVQSAVAWFRYACYEGGVSCGVATPVGLEKRPPRCRGKSVERPPQQSRLSGSGASPGCCDLSAFQTFSGTTMSRLDCAGSCEEVSDHRNARESWASCSLLQGTQRCGSHVTAL